MSELVSTHQPCPACGSSDALSVNSDGWSHCFSCGDRKKVGGDETTETTKTRKKLKSKALIDPGEFRPLAKRHIHQETCEQFGYTVGDYEGTPVQIAAYHNATGKLVAQKLRFPDKNFLVTGDMSEAALFGQRLWKPGKRLVVTEGEIDALSYAQASGKTWPVVSVPNGAAGAKKAVQKQLEWIEQFEAVVFLFDNDEPGREAALECADLLTPGKAFIAQLPLKDANDMLADGRVKELQQAVWNAKPHRPDGVINASELWDAVSTPEAMGKPYPWAGLNAKLFGLRECEIVTLTSGSGTGKSTVCGEIAFDLAQRQNEKVGYVALEESVARTAKRFVGFHLNKPVHLPGHSVGADEYRRAFDATCGTGRYHLYDHFGSLDPDVLLNKLAYMVKGCGTRWLVLDHLSIVVSGMDLDADERRAIDNTMTRLRQFTQRTKAGLILVSHLKRPEGNRGHEDGLVTSLSHLRGSAAIAQLSDAVIGIERDQQDDDARERNTVTLRVLKNRYAGITGIAGKLRYDDQTGRLTEVTDFDDEAGPQVSDEDIPF